MTTRQIIRKAIKLLTSYGWTKGQYGNKKCGFCALGAIQRAALLDLDGDAYARAIAKIEKLANTENIVTWNDDFYTTEADVLKTLREAAR